MSKAQARTGSADRTPAGACAKRGIAERGRRSGFAKAKRRQAGHLSQARNLPLPLLFPWHPFPLSLFAHTGLDFSEVAHGHMGEAGSPPTPTHCGQVAKTGEKLGQRQTG